MEEEQQDQDGQEPEQQDQDGQEQEQEEQKEQEQKQEEEEKKRYVSIIISFFGHVHQNPYCSMDLVFSLSHTTVWDIIPPTSILQYGLLFFPYFFVSLVFLAPILQYGFFF